MSVTHGGSLAARCAAGGGTRLRVVLLVLGVLAGAVALSIGFLPQRDLDDYERLVGGEGVVVPAELTRGGDLCAAWRFEVAGQERLHTEPHHCYGDEDEIEVGDRGQVVYDPDDLGVVFERSAVVRDALHRERDLLRLASVAGGIVLVGCAAGLSLLRHRRGRWLSR